MVPLGIGVSLLRQLLDESGFAKGTWYKIHFYTLLFAFFLSAGGFALAVFLVENEEGESHFDDLHHIIGTVVMAVMLLQVLFAYFRPDLPKASVVDGPMPEKSRTRKSWEIGHRVFGALLLGGALYNCYTGLQLQNENWQDQTDYSVIFWGITVGLIGMILLLYIFVKLVY